jgi:Fur family ferric uptake transcriptional regulator
MDSKKLLKINSLKQTKARVNILDILIDTNKPLSYEDIKSHLSVSMDKATFYRNVSLLEESDILNRFEADDKRWYFELKTSQHSHFLCKECNSIECIHDMSINLPKDYIVENVIIKGTCSKCNKDK